jgi:hypothetical protein
LGSRRLLEDGLPSAVLTLRERAAQREDLVERGADQRALVFGLLGREIRHVVLVGRQPNRFRLEALELEVAEVGADLVGGHPQEALRVGAGLSSAWR